jgi:hypothetical protein
MRFTVALPLLGTITLTMLGVTTVAQAQQAEMSFFVTSIGQGWRRPRWACRGTTLIARRSPRLLDRPRPTGERT